MWAIVGILLTVWFVLKFFLHKGGFIHILLLTAISIAVVQMLAHRKTRYENDSARRRDRPREQGNINGPQA